MPGYGVPAVARRCDDDEVGEYRAKRHEQQRDARGDDEEATGHGRGRGDRGGGRGCCGGRGRRGGRCCRCCGGCRGRRRRGRRAPRLPTPPPRRTSRPILRARTRTRNVRVRPRPSFAVVCRGELGRRRSDRRRSPKCLAFVPRNSHAATHRSHARAISQSSSIRRVPVSAQICVHTGHTHVSMSIAVPSGGASVSSHAKRSFELPRLPSQRKASWVETQRSAVASGPSLASSPRTRYMDDFWISHSALVTHRSAVEFG